MIPVTLTGDEVAWASEVATARLASTKVRNPNLAVSDSDAHATHWMGARGEVAFANAMGMTWPAKPDTYGIADIDPYWKVRTSGNPMVVKVSPRDPANGLVAQVTELNHRSYVVAGYIRVAWAREHIRASDPGNRGALAHFVPSNRLSPIEPGFHDLHQWFKDGDWLCTVCGVPWTSTTRKPPSPAL